MYIVGFEHKFSSTNHKLNKRDQQSHTPIEFPLHLALSKNNVFNTCVDRTFILTKAQPTNLFPSFLKRVSWLHVN